MNICMTVRDQQLEDFIQTEFEGYERKYGVAFCRTPFAFAAKEQGEVVGAVTGFCSVSEVHISELGVKEGWRGKGIGGRLIRAVEDDFQDAGLSHISLTTYEYQAPSFYQKLGFELEFVRRDRKNEKWNKYYFVKYFGADRKGERESGMGRGK